MPQYAWVIFVVAMIGVFAFAQTQKKRRIEFARALLLADEQVQTGSAEIDGLKISKDTYLCTYELCFSWIIGSYKFHSAYAVPGTPKAIITSILFSVLSLITGWWSIWGLFWTPMVIVSNLTNANRKQAISILEDLKAQLPST